MSVSAVASSPPVSPYQPVHAASRGRADNDGDEATESTATKAKEAAKQPPSNPANSNRGSRLNVTV